MTHYDVLVIGTGSGNSIINHRFDDLSVAIAESARFGGTCLNVGCIPTKMFVHTADLARDAADGERFGIDTAFNGANWKSIRDRIFSRIDQIESSGRAYRTHELDNVTVYPEHVEFTGARSFRTASGKEFTADRIVIATGSHPVVPEAEGLDPQRVDTPGYPVRTSDTVMRIDALPESMVVIGGGIIAAEFAHVFSSLGVDVTVLVRGERMLKNSDELVSERFTQAFGAAPRIDLRTGTTATHCEIRADAAAAQGQPGARAVRLTTDAGDVIDTDLVLVATGRTPSTERLGLEHTDIDVEDGSISVDEYQRVLSGGKPLPGVFALGDVCSDYQLKHVANHEARIVKANLLADIASGSLGGAQEADLTEVNHHAVPAAVFSHPQSAGVGLTEAEAREAGFDFTVKVQEYSDVAYGWALEDRTGFCKVIADRTSGQILGAHILGAEASMIIQPLIQAMSFALPADQMAKHQYWIHPALPEVVENALLGLELG